MKADSPVLVMAFLLVGAVAAAAACGTDQEPKWETAETIPFLVCESSETWTRPSDEEQSQHVWYGPRYYGSTNWDLSQFLDIFYEDFVHWHGGASERLDLGLQHGFWSARDISPGDPKCARGGTHMYRGESISVYLLLHEAKDVRLSGNTYWIVVQETPSGFQEIQFTNLLFPENTTEEYPMLDHTVVIVDVEGRELARAEGNRAFHEAGEGEAESTSPAPERAGAIERAKQASAADRAKPRFRGELGDFVVVERGTLSNYPCPEGHRPGTDPERSELYFELPGDTIDGVGSCQGTIISIDASIADAAGGALVSRGYFLGPKLETLFDAPAERLKLITVGGKPALAELPVPDCIVCTSQVAIVERFPSEQAPGIAVWVRTTNDLDRAMALAEQIMGMR